MSDRNGISRPICFSHLSVFLQKMWIKNLNISLKERISTSLDPKVRIFEIRERIYWIAGIFLINVKINRNRISHTALILPMKLFHFPGNGCSLYKPLSGKSFFCGENSKLFMFFYKPQGSPFSICNILEEVKKYPPYYLKNIFSSFTVLITSIEFVLCE